MQRVLFVLLLLGLAIYCGRSTYSEAGSVPKQAAEENRFEALVANYQNLTFSDLAKQTPSRAYTEGLSFDPSKAQFYEDVVEKLQLTDAERQILNNRGLVSVDHGQQYSFGSMYFAIYSNDLPVFVTSDSILHAMHCTYDDILMEIEQTFLTAALDEILTTCHEHLPSAVPASGMLVKNYKDVDLYLTVARNLLKGAGAPTAERFHPIYDLWDDKLLVNSELAQDEAALAILKQIQSLVQQSPQYDEKTPIYGGKRAIDYSQFKPRGHYTKTVPLARYFRTMMWLGRADTGWNLLPPDPASGIESDVPRELRNAALLTQLLTITGAIDRLEQIYAILDFMIGDGDNLTPPQTATLLRHLQVTELKGLTANAAVESFQQSLRNEDFGTQQIRSQIVTSDPRSSRQVAIPSLFQMFGQRYVVDSFVFSKVVFDSIQFQGRKVERYMPNGLDVMFALGNNTVLPLLEEELTRYPYAANLKACQQYVAELEPEFWHKNLYNLWLGAIRTLHSDQSTEQHLPQVMRTATWQRKQLQTQLASWAELRHNTVLYAKQSYSAQASCEYPAGFVEPYPELYARIKTFAEEAARRIDAANYSTSIRDFTDIKRRQIDFFKQMAATLDQLETLARKELAAEPFTDDDQEWLKKVVDIRSRGSGRPTYTGWYCQLYYKGGHRSAEWDPTIIDVHTDPNTKEALHVGVGNCNYLIVAIDNEDDHRIYVGPAYSYYEFQNPAEDRLTDQAWQQLLIDRQEPTRPAWIKDFQAERLDRRMGNPGQHE
jgi:hypothetical protein